MPVQMPTRESVVEEGRLEDVLKEHQASAQEPAQPAPLPPADTPLRPQGNPSIAERQRPPHGFGARVPR